MACFLAPAAEAVVTTVIQKKIEKKEKVYVQESDIKTVEHKEEKISWSRKLKWLNAMLWGGSALLLIEHIWHGEIVFWPPFLTAMATPAETMVMLKEIALYGTAMAAVITVVWFAMTVAADAMVKKGLLSAGKPVKEQ